MYVRNKMTSNPYTIDADASISDALDIMQENRIRRLPVVKNGKLVGLVTEREIKDASPSRATTLSAHEVSYLLEKTKISDAMTKTPLTVDKDALLEEAAVIMGNNKLSALPVMSSGELVGIITETDIFSAFIDILGFRDRGSRLTVEATDTPGILADVAKVISDAGANISRVAVYGGESSDKKDIVIRMNSLNTEPIVKVLEQHGYRVIHVLKNQ